jgi:undecaprenyl diphosphate synthase
MTSFSSVPRHIAIIMDGNGRWATNRGLPRGYGHNRGVRTVERIIDLCLDLKVEFLTLYTFSTENWRRPQKEVDFLMKTLEENIENNLSKLTEDKNIRLRVLGQWQKLPGELPQKIEEIIRKTENFKDLNLSLAINYGSRQEILKAVTDIADDISSAKIKSQDIDQPLLESYLYTSDIPDPDLLIRTAGEYRLSNYLLWQIAYTEFYFTKKFWPDFGKVDFFRAIASYNKRRRKYGTI